MRRVLCLLWFVLGVAAQAQEPAQLGLFGTVTSVTPLVVAGQRVVVPDGLSVISPLGAGQVISRGDTLAIRAEVRSGKLVAQRMLAIYPVVGPVHTVQGQIAKIMGTNVYVPPDASVRPNLWYAVSGLWSGETIVTTKLRKVDGAGFAHLTGMVDAESQQIGGSAISGAQPPQDGFGTDIWLLSGTPLLRGLRAQLLSKGVFGGDVDLALWEGYASLPVAYQTYVIYGTGISGRAVDAQMPEAGEWIMRCVQNQQTLKAPPDGLHTAYMLLGCARHTRAD